MVFYDLFYNLLEDFSLDYLWTWTHIFQILGAIFLFNAFFFLIHIGRMVTLSEERLPVAEHILFIVAHPDDEAMFFTPAIRELSRHNIIHILCLSTGNYDGEGAQR
jgi:hypothetical protein